MLTETVTITATFGSDMQRDVAMTILLQMLAAWQSETEAHHRKNCIDIVHEHHGRCLTPSWQGNGSTVFPL
jgi:hypothetical protein